MKTYKKVFLLLGTFSLVSGVTACATAGSKEGQSASNVEQSDVSLPAPVIMTPQELSGATVSITADQPLVISVDEPINWSGGAEDESVVKFVNGRKTDSAEFNPGFEAVSQGTTAASISDENEVTYDFTIVVE